MHRWSTTIGLAAVMMLAVASPLPAQDAPRVLERGVARVSARRHVAWPSRAGEVRVSVSVVDHAVTLRIESDHAPARTHTFEGVYFGEPLYADYGTWNDGALDVRLFERPPSLGWPRFTACAHVEARGGAVVIVDTVSPAEWGCTSDDAAR